MKYAAWLAFIVLLSSMPASEAQLIPESVYAFDLQAPVTTIEIPAGESSAAFDFTLRDFSKDAPDGITGDESGVGVEIHRHSFSFQYAEGDNPAGFAVLLPAPMRTYGGEQKEGTLTIQFQPTVVRDPVLSVTLMATHKHRAGEDTTNITFTVITRGPETYNALLQGAVQLQPNEIGQATVRVTNSGLLPREFVFEMGTNDCNLDVGFEAFRVVPAKSSSELSITILGPDDRFYYNSEICNLDLRVFPTDQTGNVRTLALNPIVTGTQIDPVWVFNTVGVLLAAFIIFLLIARRKARIEEEILGRPQKPWLIPVEQVYLEHLRERDPQAHYVVRHFLMEEEYQSSLLWYNDYKKATKGARSKERLVVSQEHKYERFQKRWKRKVAAPHKQVDRLEVRLQKKLDREGKAGARKARSNWKKLTKKMQAGHKAKVAKATKKWEGQVAKWEKQAARAQKKGTAVPEKPPKPDIAEPDYPPEPTGDRILLASHKWNKKVVKARAKAEKETGNLEVKFEKKDAKMLRKVRRKVTKIARKLDDPEFASEHPLLAES